MTLYALLQPPEAPRALYVFGDKTDLQGYIRRTLRLSPLPLPTRHTVDDLLHLLRTPTTQSPVSAVTACRYWFVDSCWGVVSAENQHSNDDVGRFGAKNYFATKEDAEVFAEALRTFARGQGCETKI